MRILDSPDIFGHATFCDDIRFEADGKITFVGTYTGTMFVRGAFPATLPKFGIFIEFRQRRSVFDPNLSIRVFMPDDTDEKASIEVDAKEFAAAAVAQAAEQASKDEQELPYIALNSPAIFAPFTINQPGALKVRILRRDELHRIGTLRIVAAG